MRLGTTPERRLACKLPYSCAPTHTSKAGTANPAGKWAHKPETTLACKLPSHGTLLQWKVGPRTCGRKQGTKPASKSAVWVAMLVRILLDQIFRLCTPSRRQAPHLTHRWHMRLPCECASACHLSSGLGAPSRDAGAAPDTKLAGGPRWNACGCAPGWAPMPACRLSWQLRKGAVALPAPAHPLVSGHQTNTLQLALALQRAGTSGG